MDASSFDTIHGRVKQFSKVADEMVSLKTVEQITYAVSSDHQHAATTQSDTQRGENVVLYTTDTVLAHDAMAHLASHTGNTELAVARRIVLVKALPLLRTGKTDYVTLKQMAKNEK